MNERTKIYVAGHRGLVGSALLRRLTEAGYTNLVTRTHAELDLTSQSAVLEFFRSVRPEIVILAAAKVGGIHANNTYPADFLTINSQIATNVITAAHEHGTAKVINLGSSCIYPKHAPQPLKEEYLLSGPLEATNEAYAIAKIQAIKLCRYFNAQYGTNFISAMPSNLYGPGDNFDLQSSHVLPALIRKVHEAKRDGAREITLWGDGTPLREFLYVDDLTEAVRFLMESVDAKELSRRVPDCFVNVGSGVDISIADLASTIAEVLGWSGSFRYDTSKPNGTPRKLLDCSIVNELGWKAKTSLAAGIERTYRWYVESDGEGRR